MKIFAFLALLLLPGLALAQPSSLQTNYSGMFGWNSSLNKWTGIPYSGGGLAVSPTLPATSTAINGTTSATAGTWTEALAASATRVAPGCEIQNTGTAAMYVGIGSTPAEVKELQPGDSYYCKDQSEIWVEPANATAVTYTGQATQ